MKQFKQYAPLFIIPLALASFHLFANEPLPKEEPLNASVVAPEDYTRAQALEDMQAVADRLEASSRDLLKVAQQINELTKDIKVSN